MCELCDSGEVESESCFLLYCTNDDDLSEIMFHEMPRQNPEILWCTDEQQLQWLLNLDVFKFAKFVSNAWKRKQDRSFN